MSKVLLTLVNWELFFNVSVAYAWVLSLSLLIFPDDGSCMLPKHWKTVPNWLVCAKILTHHYLTTSSPLPHFTLLHLTAWLHFTPHFTLFIPHPHSPPSNSILLTLSLPKHPLPAHTHKSLSLLHPPHITLLTLPSSCHPPHITSPSLLVSP